MIALAPHLPEAETLRLAEHYRDSFVAQRAVGRRGRARAALSRGARRARPARRGAGHAPRRRHRQGAARARPSLRVLPDRAPLRDHPDRRRPSLEAAPLDAARRARRDRRRGRAVGDGRRHRVRRGDGPRRRHGDGRRRLGLPPAGAARGRRRRRHHRRLRRRSTPPSTGSGRRRDHRPPPLLGGAPRRCAEGGGFGVRLDGRPLRTPAGAPLVVPTEALAAAIAAEWDALDGEIRPERLPFTRAANVAIDRVAPRPGPGRRRRRRLRRHRPALLPRRRARGPRRPSGRGLGPVARVVGAGARRARSSR